MDDTSDKKATVLFARVGWMYAYAGPVPGDRPIGGGKYNKEQIGHEAYNFLNVDGYVYGYFQPSMRTHTVALERIDDRGRDSDSLDDVLLIFIAPSPNISGQVIVGWHRNATVFRKSTETSPGKPSGFGHFCIAAAAKAVLLPENRRIHQIPTGKGGMGQSNICYPLEQNGALKTGKWIGEAIDFVSQYQSENILKFPEAAAEDENIATIEKALSRSQGQGFARNPEERRALENHSMATAKTHFERAGFIVEDVSKSKPYDLLCCQGDTKLHVEVKGTTTDGGTVVLTNNEVKHTSDPRNNCVLFILHSIQLIDGRASGGSEIIYHPWNLDYGKLTPVTFTYRH